MTIPSTNNSDKDAENGKGEGTPLLSTPLLSSFRKSESAVSGRSVRFDDDSHRSESQRSRPHPFHSASSYLEHFTQSERDRALKQPGVGKAAFLIRDAISGTTENPSDGAYNPYVDPDCPLKNTISILCGRVCASRPFRKFIYAVIWTLVFLSFIEPPAWCFDIPGLETNDEDVMNVGHCHRIMELRGPPADDPESDQEVEYYPNSILFLLSRAQAAIFESICLFIIGIYLLMMIGRDGSSPAIFFRPSHARLSRVLASVSTAALAISMIVTTFRQGYHSRYERRCHNSSDYAV